MKILGVGTGYPVSWYSRVFAQTASTKSELTRFGMMSIIGVFSTLRFMILVARTGHTSRDSPNWGCQCTPIAQSTSTDKPGSHLKLPQRTNIPTNAFESTLDLGSSSLYQYRHTFSQFTALIFSRSRTNKARSTGGICNRFKHGSGR